MNDDGEGLHGRGDDDPLPPAERGRSVFAADAPVPAVRPPATEPLPPAGPQVLDGAAFGLYEEDPVSYRGPARAGAVLAVVALLVGVLVWRAVNTPAELDLPPEATTSSTAPVEASVPTVAAAMALVPDVVTTCTAPDAQPDDEPRRVVLQCPLDGVPEGLAFVLYATNDERDAAFDAIVDEFAVPTSGTDCALGQLGAHDYIGVQRVGRVACHADAGRVDFVWTTDDAPLLVRSGGGGRYADHYDFWARLVDRTDAAFPLPAERDLLDHLPAPAQVGCGRDLGLAFDVRGIAVRCEPADDRVDVVSSVQFTGADAMNAWIASRRDVLRDNVFSSADDACTPDGFGRHDVPPAPTTTTADPATTVVVEEDDPLTPPPDAGFTDYDFGGGSGGSILCFVNSAGLDTLFWTRNGTRIASVAVSDRAGGATMPDLLRWWRGRRAPSLS